MTDGAEQDASGAAERQRREVLERELAAALRDRRRLAEQLHDSPQQLLISVGMRLRLLAEEVPASARDAVQEIARQVSAAREELRALSLARCPTTCT